MFETLLNSVTYGDFGLVGLVVCTVVSLILGFAVSFIYQFRNTYSHSMAATLVLLPALVQIIIMLASGNIGIGVAVAGAFSLIRFRSVPGNAKDIGHLFLSMSLGFVTGLGYLFYAFVLLLLVGSTSLLLSIIRFGQELEEIRILQIKIPEDLDFEGLFDEVFSKYTDSVELQTVKTTQMGSLYELTYAVCLKPDSATKGFIDDLRIRNGNLGITISRKMQNLDDL